MIKYSNEMLDKVEKAKGKKKSNITMLEELAELERRLVQKWKQKEELHRKENNINGKCHIVKQYCDNVSKINALIFGDGNAHKERLRIIKEIEENANNAISNITHSKRQSNYNNKTSGNFLKNERLTN